MNRKLDLEEWKEIDIYNHGLNYGGKLCSTLQQYGWSMLIPIIANVFFGILLWYNDIKRKESYSFEIVFALFCFYPQWKVIKLLFKYCIGSINEEQLNEQKEQLEGSVLSIEPFVESCVQV